MKKMYVMVLVVAVVMLLTAGMAMAGIATTKHNLSSSTSNAIKGDIAEICVYCHTPHGGDSSIPLWNRAAGTSAVVPYSSTTPTFYAMPGYVSGVSRACMTCHDGTTAVNTLTNYGGAAKAGGGAGTVITNTFTLLGTDMTNDHPVGIPMNNLAALPSGYQLPTNAALARVFGTSSTVECASCHDVHGVTGVALFLRAANTESQICTQCHLK